jgi:aminobenzoyl-glutamate utilization protein B
MSCSANGSAGKRNVALRSAAMMVAALCLSYAPIAIGVTFHNWRAGVTPISSISHKGQVAGAKVLAATVLDLLTEPEVLKRAKEQFALDTKGSEYFSLLPPEAKPPLDMNRATMEKYRAEMRKFYTNRTPVFQ